MLHLLGKLLPKEFAVRARGAHKFRKLLLLYDLARYASCVGPLNFITWKGRRVEQTQVPLFGVRVLFWWHHILLQFAHGHFRTTHLKAFLAHVINIDYCRLLFQIVTWVGVFMMWLQVIKDDFIIVLPLSNLTMSLLYQLLLSQAVIWNGLVASWDSGGGLVIRALIRLGQGHEQMLALFFLGRLVQVVQVGRRRHHLRGLARCFLDHGHRVLVHIVSLVGGVGGASATLKVILTGNLRHLLNAVLVHNFLARTSALLLVEVSVYFISCRLIQIAHLFARIFQWEVVFGSLGLLFSLAPRLESSLEEAVWGEHFRFLIGGRHSNCLLHLIEVGLSFAEYDTLHAPSWHTSWVSKDESVVLCVAAGFWRQVQNFGRLLSITGLQWLEVALHSKVSCDEVQLSTLGAQVVFCGVVSRFCDVIINAGILDTARI